MDKLEDLKNKIFELEKENELLIRWQESVNQLLNKILNMITDQKNCVDNIFNELHQLQEYTMINRYRIDSLPYELMDPNYNSFFFKPCILSKNETIRQIIEEHKSIARLGDGEFAAIVGQKRWNFQEVSDVLAIKLREVIASDEEGLIVGLNPTFYMNLFDMPDKDADAVRAYMRPMVRKLHAELLNQDKVYGNALFHSIKSCEDIENLKHIWEDRECVFIEGVYTRMGIGNDLFDNCRKIERILCPAENAIDKLEDIVFEAGKLSKNKLVLLALGPTATVLAYELHKKGYQAIDIGHVDLIYESYIRNVHDFNYVEIPYKYCKANEWQEGLVIEDVEDPAYESQIIARIL